MIDLPLIGRALFGYAWLGAMQDRTGVSERSLRYMAAQKRPIPDGLKTELAVLLRAEAKRLKTIVDVLESGPID